MNKNRHMYLDGGLLGRAHNTIVFIEDNMENLPKENQKKLKKTIKKLKSIVLMCKILRLFGIYLD